MKRITRRALSCAAVAATGALTLSGTALGQTTFPEKTGDGVPTGQASIQLFTHSGYISTGSGTGTASPIDPASIKPASDGTQCATSVPPNPNANPPVVGDPPTRLLECRWNRLDALFGYFAANGLDSVELFGHAGLPANENIDGPFGWKQYRELLDKHNLHAAGWHGSLNEAAWPARVAAAKVIGLDYIGTGNGQADGFNLNNYDQILRSAETLNRLGKYSVENGVGPVYLHNHTSEFDNKHMDNGVLKTAWDIQVERTDPRYVVYQVDAFWATDAFDDATGAATAAFINKYPTRVKLMHVKDGVCINWTQGGNGCSANAPTPPNTRTGSPRAFGTGDVDYRPILAAGKGKVQYYSQEQDGANLTDMVTSLRNLKGRGPNVVPSVLALPTTFPSVAAGTAAAANVVPVTIKNTGDAPLTITNIALANSTNATSQQLVREGERPGDFMVVDAAGCTAGAIAPNATCFVNVGFKPTSTNTKSVARLIVLSNADNATESILLNGQSTGDATGGVSGNVPTTLSLTLGAPSSFGSFVPATARTYDAGASATVVSTAGNATLSVTDSSAAATGKLVNGTFSLSQPLQVNATNAATTTSAFAPLSMTAGTPTNLLTYNGPTAGADNVTIGFRQAIVANEVLRSGSYSKSLTFTLSTTQP